MAKILVIDDEAALLRSITAYLEDSGFTAESAENGKAGLEKFAQNKADLVLTDLHMPVMGGLDVLHTIGKQDPDVPVIVISGAGELNDAIQALRLGAWDYITKPIADLQVLEHAIKKALERKTLREENKSYAQRIEANLKILEEDQAAGRKVQMSLLPPDSQSIKEFEFKYKIMPSLELSGDFVEYFTINEDHVGLYLADVSGHGSSSAFVTILLKSIIAKYLVQYRIKQDATILHPQSLMRELSNEIYAAKLGKYITLIYGVLNTQTYEFTYGIGGHYPNPILFGANTNTEILPGSGFPIGIKADADYTEQTIKLLTGQNLVMFTDGVMEVFMPGKSLDEKERALLAAVQASKADISVLLRTCGLTTTTKMVQPDDVTIFVISHS